MTRFFWEPPQPGATPGVCTRPGDTVDVLLRWQASFDDHDGRLLAKRLAWDGWCEDDVATFVAVGSPSPPPADVCPGRASATADFAALPFGDLIGILVDDSSRRLLARLRMTDAAALAAPPFGLGADAMRGFERHLAERLLKVLGPTLMAEFEAHRPFGSALLASLWEDDAPGQRPTGAYAAFVEHHRADRLGGLCAAYPVLSRFLRRLADDWVEATAEFLDRVAADRAALAAAFGVAVGVVVGVETGLSDPHWNGRCVAIVRFDGGTRLVYKPRSLRNDARFAALCAWSNAQGLSLDLQTVPVLDRGTHGWAGFVEHRLCDTPVERGRFYRRAGMLLAWLRTLGATDCHQENLIACGEHPVLIDLETLLQPDPVPIDGDLFAGRVEHEVNRRLKRSVLRSGLLPNWSFSADGTVGVDISGLGGIEPSASMVELGVWEHVNTDAMSLRLERVLLPRARNAPAAEGDPRDLLAQADRIAEGFAEMYRLIRDRRDSLLAPDGPLRAFSRSSVRVLLRDTQVYATLQDRALRPACLRHALDCAIEIDRLALAFLACEDRPPAWCVVRAEQEALARLDVPVFSARADDVGLYLGDVRLCDFFERPAWDGVRSAVAAMGEDDLAFQQGLIRGAVSARVAALPGGAAADAPSRGERPRFATADFRAEALAVGERLAASALTDASGVPNWIGLCAIPSAGRFQLQGAGDDLYDGRAGIALFFAALHLATGQPRWRSLALKTIGAMQWLEIRNPGPSRLGREMVTIAGVGGMTGVGGAIYALATMSSLLGDTGLAEQAGSLAGLIAPDDVSRRGRIDVLDGGAGAVLALLALHRATGAPAVLDRARQVGDHIVAWLQGGDGAFHRRRADGGPMLTGLSHGAAGVAHALLALHAATGEATHRAAARDCIAHERSLFDDASDNWPDLRGRDGAVPGTALSRWCHGAPGIALARLFGRPHDPSPALDREIECAVATTLALGDSPVDHVCCGNFGIADILGTVGAQLGDRRCTEAARALASRAVRRAQAGGAYTLFATLPAGAENAGFFVGLSGIGYGLLRLHGVALPSVLALEPAPGPADRPVRGPVAGS